MRASVIQLKELRYQKICVDLGKPLEELSSLEAEGFDYNGVNFQVRLESGPVAIGEAKESNVFHVRLGIIVNNESGKIAPYKIDMMAVGIFEVAETVDAAIRADLAMVNGASIIYGAIRETVVNLTSRSVAGTSILPTMDFRDHSKNPQNSTVSSAKLAPI
jgi:preprotein translocase subunit SecB